MGVTYTSRGDRGRSRRVMDDAGRRGQRVLLVTAAVSVAAIALCYTGRLLTFQKIEHARPGPTVVSLVDVTDASALEAALAPAFEHIPDRRLAARELLRHLNGGDRGGTREPLTHVGALSRLRVTAGTVDGTQGLVTYAGRLRTARERALAVGDESPATIPLFSAGDVAAIKPGLVVRSASSHRSRVFWSAALFVLGFQLLSFVWWLRGIRGDRLLLAAAHLLTTLGFLVMLSRPDPLRDSLLIVRYTQGVLLGLATCAVVSLIRIRTAPFLQWGYLALCAAAGLSLAVMLFGDGPAGSGAKVNLGPVQPIEAIRLLLAFFLAAYFGRRWELMRQLRETEWRGRAVPGWIDLPRLDYLLPVGVGVAVSLILFFVLRDLGPALLVSLTFLAMLAVARGRAGMVAGGIALLAAGFAGGYWLNISSTLAARVAMWRSPWDNAVRGGDQVAHAVWAMAAGGPVGTGLGLGDTRYLPTGYTDLVLASVSEELGVIGVLLAVVAVGIVAWRGLHIARGAPTDATVFLGLAMTLSLVVPVLVMAAGTLGLIPLTGVVTPFLSYGGSAMVVNFVALGLLAAIASDTDRSVDSGPFVVPFRWVGRTLTAGATAVFAVWATTQVLQADDYLVRPQLGVQADGGLRYQYNPRVMDAARSLPRGTVFDRRDVPLAAEPSVAMAAERELSRMRVAVREACPNPAERCYPLGGAAFHLLGDARTRLNWSASNTSYVERDGEDTLRGFDDRAAVVSTGGIAEGDGPQAPGPVALRRDYRDLVALVRHRWQPDHPDVVAVMTRPRDVHLTIDARLQAEIASIVARRTASGGTERAAVVVVDADTGEVLASVSHPWPLPLDEGGIDAAPEALLDRARYGLYPPGSTFKLVTAAAALRRNPDAARVAFSCQRLPDGRAGARIPGLGRPVRDDVKDRHPHGTLSMRDGLVRSCNAYFAQLAVEVGTDSLGATAHRAGIVFPTTGSPERLRATLPHAGYGQGDVLATPLRMARLAAAIASDGRIRETSIVRETPSASRTDAAQGTAFLTPSSARVLARYMREAVTEGTGRLLRHHPVAIAGKTGTAEVDEAASHAWFVGFAPAGPATRRVAFAVLLENAGYGGAGAAAMTGEVVTAAATLGWIK